jgi:hypothetical protein
MLFCVPCWAFLGPLALHLRLLAIVIIPNLLGMFNENQTFFGKNLLDAGFWMLDTRKKFYR